MSDGASPGFTIAAALMALPGGREGLDLFVAINLYNTYDNRPPNPEANTNDVGIVLSIGWTY